MTPPALHARSFFFPHHAAHGAAAAPPTGPGAESLPAAGPLSADALLQAAFPRQPWRNRRRHADQAARRRDQARRPAPIPAPAFVGITASRALVGVSLCALPLSVGGRGIPLSAARRDPGRRDGPGQDHAGHHRRASADPLRRAGQRAFRLSQAPGEQLAPRVRPVGPRDPGAGDRGGSGQAGLAMGVGRVPVRIANFELLCRDHLLLAGHQGQGQPRLHFDLVVLDEAQRDQEPRRHDPARWSARSTATGAGP